MLYWMKRILFGARIDMCPKSQRDALAERVKELEYKLKVEEVAAMKLNELAIKAQEENDKLSENLRSLATPVPPKFTPPPKLKLPPLSEESRLVDFDGNSRVSLRPHCIADLRRAFRAMDDTIRDMYPISNLVHDLKEEVVAACYSAILQACENMYAKPYNKEWKKLLKVLKVRGPVRMKELHKASDGDEWRMVSEGDK